MEPLTSRPRPRRSQARRGGNATFGPCLAAVALAQAPAPADSLRADSLRAAAEALPAGGGARALDLLPALALAALLFLLFHRRSS